jgi:hypothetical protein
MRVFVPEGLNDSSQAIYCLGCVQRGDPSRRDGVIGSDRRATIRTINQLGYGSDRALRDGFSIGCVPGNELPGYDHRVPPGQNLVVWLKLTLMWGEPESSHEIANSQ